MQRSRRNLGSAVLALPVASAGLIYGLYRRELAAAKARLAGASEVVAPAVASIRGWRSALRLQHAVIA